jgi:hypothetical protein
MKTFTITEDNNITAFASKKAAEVAAAAPFATLPYETFDSLSEFEQLAGSWTGHRLIEIWNSIPGLTPVAKFTSRKVAIGRVWKAIQSLTPIEPPEPQPEPEAAAAPQPKAQTAPRDGTKTAQVVSMLEREGGATIFEIMQKMGWQKHTVRGFMAGAMKKAGHVVESFKPDGGERTYRISK